MDEIFSSITIYSIPSIIILLYALFSEVSIFINRDMLPHSSYVKVKSSLLRMLVFMLFAYLFIISAFRFQVGKDYNIFRNVFNNLNNGQTSYTEPLYNLLNRMLGSVLHLDFVSIFALISFMVCYSYYSLIKNFMSKQYWLIGVYLYINLGTYFFSMNLIRQYLAISIFLLALPSCLSGKKIKLLISIICAYLIHSSTFILAIAVVLFILYVRLNPKTQTKILYILWIISMILMFYDVRFLLNYFTFIIPDRLEYYLAGFYLQQRNNLAILKQIPLNIFLFCILVSKSQNKINTRKEFIVFGSFLYVVILNLFCGATGFLRIAYMFDAFFILATPFVIEAFPQHFQKPAKVLYYIYFSILTIVTIYIFGGPGVMPYHFITDYWR
jgi:hypothetical protein